MEAPEAPEAPEVLEEVLVEEQGQVVAGTDQVVADRVGEVVPPRPGLRVAIQAAKGVVEAWRPAGVAEVV